MITLFGATGQTGWLTAQALERLSPGPFRLAGRSPEKLARLAASLPSHPPWLLADATRPETLPPLFHSTRVLINCAGPFTDLGEAVVAQAALRGVHYLDTANELGYVHRIQSYDNLARRNGAAIVPACGFEVALADCAVNLLARDEPAETRLTFDEAAVVYAIGRGGTSVATRRSAVRALATSWLGYRHGRWAPTAPGGAIRRFCLPGGARLALSFPSSEHVTIPSHTPVRRVTTWMVFPWLIALAGVVATPMLAGLARGALGKIMWALAGLCAPSAGDLCRDAAFTVQVMLRCGETARSMVLTGQGVYGLTAEIIACAAGWMLAPDYTPTGVLAPAVAFDPSMLLCHTGFQPARPAQTGHSTEREGNVRSTRTRHRRR